MPYATLADLTGYLNQFRDEDPDNPDVETLDACLDRAEGIINLELGVTTSLAAAASATRTLYGDGGLYLTSDTPMSTVTLIEAPAGYTVPDYIEHNGRIRIADSVGVISYSYVPGLSSGYGWSIGGWGKGVPYEVTATFGYSASVMAALEEACLQIAVRLYLLRDKGGTGVITTGEAGAIVSADYSPIVAKVLALVGGSRRGSNVGVW